MDVTELSEELKQMNYPEYLEEMPTFRESRGKIISSDEEPFEPIISEWAKLISEQHRKGLIPLFITGSGVSKSGTKPVPDIFGIIDKLKKEYEGRKDIVPSEINELFETYDAYKKEQKNDRSIVARLLNSFQQKKELKFIWEKLNEWLLGEIIKADPTTFHKKLAELYTTVDAICLTLNFDGLLIREFVENSKHSKVKAFSLPTDEECEGFLLRNHDPKEEEKKEFIEIQIRGDILYVTCTSKGYCPQKEKEHSLWAYYASLKPGSKKENELEMLLLKCPSCGDKGISYLSFPGSYDKERGMQRMLAVIWKYLAFKVGSVTIVGVSGEWDPLIIAFLGDLLSEREIPLLIVDKEPRKRDEQPKYIIRELVSPKTHYSVALGVGADKFMEGLVGKVEPLPQKNLSYGKNGATIDKYWYDKIKDSKIEVKINLEYSPIENKLRNNLDGLVNFSQLGLKSYWLGIKNEDSKYHNRFNHSVGVMKIASYLYDSAFENTKSKSLCPNSEEKQFLRLAALLHDAGHLPFSHLIEDVFNELKWKPAGYAKSYSHVMQTNKKIEKLFESDELKTELKKIGYNITDLKNLVNGCFGVGYLDAIINSPLDADKIDYVFRDTDSTNRKISLSPQQFLKDIVTDLTISPEKFLSFSKTSAKATADLLKTRKHLYQSLYLQPGIVALEGIVKLIVKTYFVHSVKTDDLKGECDYYDLGDCKISYCINKLLDLVGIEPDNNTLQSLIETMPDKGNTELNIVSLMFLEIAKARKELLNDGFLINLKKGYKKVCEVKGEDALKALESKIIYKRIKGNKESIKETIRDVMFRIPGAAIIELSEPPKFLSHAKDRKEKERSDGTKTSAECILVPDGHFDMWTVNNKATKGINDSSLKESTIENNTIYLYPLSGELDDSKFLQALNLFDKLLNKKGLLG